MTIIYVQSDITIIVQINILALAILENFLFFLQSLNNENKFIKNKSIYLIF